MPREGFEPTRPCGQRILSPPRLPFRHLGISHENEHILSWASDYSNDSLKEKLALEATGGIEPPNRGFADPRLTTWLRRLGVLWCPGRDSNPHGLPHGPLKTACLPIPPPGQGCYYRQVGGNEVLLRSHLPIQSHLMSMCAALKRTAQGWPWEPYFGTMASLWKKKHKTPFGRSSFNARTSRTIPCSTGSLDSWYTSTSMPSRR